jgi:amino acid adenylation domain-containing protein
MLLEKRIKERNGSVSRPPDLKGDANEELRQWNDTKVAYRGAGACLHELFAAQAKLTPQSVAAVMGNQQWTYAELDERANRIAGRLQQLGVKPEERVGIFVQRSLEMTAGMLGVLKAGAAYVPLDPAYPEERIKLMVRDADVRVVLTQSWLAGQLPAGVGQVVNLDEGWETEAPAPYQAPQASPDNLAYVIYTSGSTGIPKGVMISHRSAVNHMLWMQATFSVTEVDRVLQKTPFNFDASMWELFLPLMTGACVVLARDGGHTESDYLVQVAAEQKVTILQVVPSLLRMLLDEPGLRNCKSLRLLFSGGETLPAELPARFFAQLDAGLINFYGPTEATIDATFWICKREGEETVPIGHPLANYQIHILDDQQQLVPEGESGELYIGGIGLSRGYLNRPDLTAESFVPDPFSDEPGQRLLRTGDLARRRADGAVEFMGRADHQVKLRGLRIELDEIEATLEQHPAVRHAAVILREFASGDHRLVGYVLPKNGIQPSPAELRAFLGEKLPMTMVPSVFVLLETLPLLPNGKLNRRALPMPDMTRELESDYVAPGTPLEETLATIWAEVLGQKQIGIHDNFFDLGGHSLLATRILSRVREVLRIEIPLRSLFQTPTIAGMVEVAQQITPTAGETSTASIAKVQDDADAALAGQVAQLSDAEVDLMLKRMMAGDQAFESFNPALLQPASQPMSQPVSQPLGRNFEHSQKPPARQYSTGATAHQETRRDSASAAQFDPQMQFQEAYVNYVRTMQEAWSEAQRRSREAYVAYLQSLRQIWINVDVNQLDPQMLLAISQAMAVAAVTTANTQNPMSWPQNNGFW